MSSDNDVAVTGTISVFVGAVVIYHTCKFVSRQMSFREESDARYVAKNIVKSISLAMITAPCIMFVARALNAGFHAPWSAAEAETARLLGCSYAQLDVAGLLLLGRTRRMNWTTVLHHCSVILLVIANNVADYREPCVMRAAVYLGAFSTFAFPVNMYLGMRRGMIGFYGDESFVGQSPEVVESKLAPLARFCFYLYSSTVATNLVIQIKCLLSANDRFGIGYFAYMILLGVILQDDIILLQFLYRRRKSVL